MTDIALHLTTDEIELWAQGLLPAARAMHLADCSLCRTEAERERKVILELVTVDKTTVGANASTVVSFTVRYRRRTYRHTLTARHRPLFQNRIMAMPRDIAVTLNASQMPSKPIDRDHHAASGIRIPVNVVLTICGHNV